MGEVIVAAYGLDDLVASAMTWGTGAKKLT